MSDEMETHFCRSPTPEPLRWGRQNGDTLIQKIFTELLVGAQQATAPALVNFTCSVTATGDALNPVHAEQILACGIFFL